MLGVVAAGSVKQRVYAASIQSSGKRALDWDLFKSMYVIYHALFREMGAREGIL